MYTHRTLSHDLAGDSREGQRGFVCGLAYWNWERERVGSGTRNLAFPIFKCSPHTHSMAWEGKPFSIMGHGSTYLRHLTGWL